MRELEKKLFNTIEQALKVTFNTELPEELRLDTPPNEDLGDFALGCFPLSRILKNSPQHIAELLAEKIPEDDTIEKIVATGPYLNITVRKEILFQLTISEILSSPDTFGNSDYGSGERVLIEYSAPNTNKPQHLGHARNNLLGMALSNMLEAIGHTVIRVNLVNDRGVHICKSMLAYQKFGKNKTPETEGIKGDNFVGHYYVLYEKEQQREWQDWLAGKGIDVNTLDDGQLRTLEGDFLGESKWYAQVKELLKKWEDDDPDVVELWRKMNNWVYQGFEVTYKRLGCKFDKTYYESQTYKLGKDLIDEGLKKKLFYKKEDGSVWIDLSKEKLGEKLLLRSDGTSVYMTQDLGTTKMKFNDFNMNHAVWIVGDEQIYHFQVLFKIMKKLGFQWADGCYHLAYGMIDLPSGKMKSREGTVVDADDLMNQLFEMEKKEIKKRQLGIPEDELEKTAEILAIGALKFFVLKFGPQTRMLFNPAESISFYGFTGPYLQYAYVRIRSIFRKTEATDYQGISAQHCDFKLLQQPEEIALVRRLHDFPKEIKASASAYNPSRLAGYLYELAKEFSKFYHEHSVLHAKSPALIQGRLCLAEATGIVLKRGLQLLGIDVPERM